MAENNSSAPLKTAEGAAHCLPALTTNDELPEAVIDAVAAALGDTYDCLRVWSAWSYGTMGPDDFRLVAEDGERTAEIARAAIEAYVAATQAMASQAAPAAGPLPLLVRDIARDLEITTLDACQALKGLGNFSVNSAVTADMARKLRECFPESIAEPAAVAVPEFDEWITREYPHLGPIGEGVNIAREAWHAGRAALAATTALPATGHCSAGHLATESVSRLMLEQAEAMAFCSTNEPTALLRYWFRKGYTAAAAQAEVQAEPVADADFEAWWSKAGDGRSKMPAKRAWSAAMQSAAPQAQPADALEPVRQAVRDYHYALDTRQHGGVAADAAINAIEEVLDMHWQQGLETNRRAAMAAAQEGGAA